MKTIPGIRLLFAHKNGNFGAISVTDRSCAAPISKVERHKWGRFCVTLWSSVNRYQPDCSRSEKVGGSTGIHIDLLQVDLSWVLKSERSELQCTRSRCDRASDEVSRLACFAWMDLNHIINSREEKMIDICCVGSGVKYRSLSYSLFSNSP